MTTVMVVAAATTAAAAGLLAGPAVAQASVSDRPTSAPEAALGPAGSQTAATALGGADNPFADLVEEAEDRAALIRTYARAQARLEAQERREERARERARELRARIEASRSSLRSAVVRPVAGGYRLTAGFGERSSLWSSGVHTGLDFAASTGTPVRAVADGTVLSAGYDGAYGNRVEIRHADGTVTTYSHLASLAVRGGSVAAGEVIGRVGSTGNTTGAHLHFEVQRGDGFLDPRRWLAQRYVSV